MTDPRNTLRGTIDSNRAWSGNPPSSVYHPASGNVWWGRNEKDTAGALWYVVRSVDASGATTERLRIGPNAGQGLLAVDNGWLILTIYRTSGDAHAAERVAVPGWAQLAPAAAGGAGLSPQETQALSRLVVFLGLA